MELIIRAWDRQQQKMTPEMPFMMAVGFFAGIYKEGRDLNQFVIMVYAGNPDRHGKRIFEGDILSHVIETPYGYRVVRGQMEFQKQFSQFGVAMEIEDDDPLGNHFEVKESQSGRPEIIGNIYENPELLAKK